MSTGRTTISTGHHGEFQFAVSVAGAGDYEDVMRIDENVYKGLDYLPDTYHNAISDPRTTPLVATVDGQVVAFACFWQLRADITLMTAGRMHHTFRSTGLYSNIVTHMKCVMKERHPELKHNWYVAIANDKKIKHAKVVSETLIDTWCNIVGFIAPEDMKLTSQYKQPVNVSLLDSARIQRICHDEEIRKHLFAKGYILHPDRWMAHPADPESLMAALSVGDVHSSGSLESGDLGVSVTFSMKSSIGMTLVVSYIGTLDENILHSHILKACEKYADVAEILESHGITASKTGDNFHADEVVDRPVVNLTVVFPKGINPENIKEFTREKFQANVIDDFYAFVGLFESSY